MASKRLVMTALLIFSFITPLELGSIAYAESSEVLTKGQLVRPGGGGTPRVIYCPPNMVAAGITMQSNVASANGKRVASPRTTPVNELGSSSPA